MKYRDRDDIEKHAEDQDDFLSDSPYDRYSGGADLSDDPMASDPRTPKNRKERRRERELREHREYLERERAAIKAEILAELEADRHGTETGQQREDTAGKRGAKSYAERGEEESIDESRKRKRSRFSEYLMSVLSGNILSRKEVSKIYPYLLFLAVLAFLYIANVFNMQKLYRKHERLTIEVRELRAESMTIASQKMNATRQSNIMVEIERRGLPLRESLSPNKVIKK